MGPTNLELDAILLSFVPVRTSYPRPVATVMILVENAKGQATKQSPMKIGECYRVLSSTMAIRRSGHGRSGREKGRNTRGRPGAARGIIARQL